MKGSTNAGTFAHRPFRQFAFSRRQEKDPLLAKAPSGRETDAEWFRIALLILPFGALRCCVFFFL
jgi:hypothetical protein